MGRRTGEGEQEERGRPGESQGQEDANLGFLFPHECEGEGGRRRFSLSDETATASDRNGTAKVPKLDPGVMREAWSTMEGEAEARVRGSRFYLFVMPSHMSIVIHFYFLHCPIPHALWPPSSQRGLTMSSKKFRSQASSARAASSAFGPSSFGGFGSSTAFQTAASPLSYVTELPDLSAISEPRVVVSFKNLSKKDSVTKAKALEELQDYLSEAAESGVENAILEAWVGLPARKST